MALSAAAVTVTAVTAATPAGSTASCTGSTRTWDGGGDGFTWSDGANWGGVAPGGNDIAVIPGGETAPQVEISSSTSVCDVQVGAQVSLTVDSGQSLTAQSMEAVGGVEGSPTELLGDFGLDSLDVGSGLTDYSSVDELPTIDAITVNGGFTLQPSADFLLSDNSVNLDVTGTATLGGSGAIAHLDGNGSCDADCSALFNLDGTATLAGDVQSDSLDITPTATSDINLAGHTWNVSADSFARFPDGMQVTSSPAGGALNFSDEYHLLLTGTTSIGSGSTLGLESNTVISDGDWFANSGATGALAGPGTFNWAGGELVGRLTLNSNLTTTLTGATEKDVADPQFGATLVRNEGAVTVTAGKLDVLDSLDTFENAGIVRVTGGSCAENQTGTPPYLNDKGATWAVTVPSGTASKMPAASFTNNGVLAVGLGVKLEVGGQFRQGSTGTTNLAISSPSTHSAISAGDLRLGGTLRLASAPNYKPRPPLTVKRVLSATQGRTGRFARVESTTHRSHTKWKAAYSGKKVNAALKHT